MAVTPGWHADPEDPENLRWWDGDAWTDHRRPSPGSTNRDPPPEPATEAAVAEVTTSTNAPVIIVAAAVLLALVAAGAIVVFGGEEDPAYTWQGAAISSPQLIIDAADETFLDGAAERNGSVGDDSRCYFVLGTGDGDGDGAAADTDVADYLRCGPIRFVDGDPDDLWLTYALNDPALDDPALNDQDDDDGDVVLSAAEQPLTARPSPLDDHETLSRPDGKPVPAGDGGVDEPAPPRAEPGFFLVGDTVDVQLSETDVSAVGRTTSVTLRGVGEPDRIGDGQEALRPAEDERFVAFEIAIGSGDELFGTEEEQRAAHIDTAAFVELNVDGDLRELWGEGAERFGQPLRFIASVPEGAETVELVLQDSDVVQRISLVTREPAESNIRVLTRAERQTDLGAGRVIPATITDAAGAARSVDLPVTIERAQLLYFVAENPDVVPSDPDKAFLVIRNVVASPEIGALVAGHLRLETGGDVIEARNIAPFSGPVVAFEVPADFGSGTLMIGGAAHSGRVTVDLGSPDFRVPIEIPNS